MTLFASTKFPGSRLLTRSQRLSALEGTNYGWMFWFMWNKLPGSYFFLIDTNLL